MPCKARAYLARVGSPSWSEPSSSSWLARRHDLPSNPGPTPASLRGVIHRCGPTLDASVPAATVSASYRTSDRDRLGAFAFLSPEGRGVPRLFAVGGTWDVLLARSPLGPYATLGIAGVRQTELEAPPCSLEGGCFDEGGVDRSGFTSAAAVLGGGTRFDLGRGGFIRTDARVLAGLELVRPLLSIGGGVRL